MLLFADGFNHYGSTVADMLAGYWAAFETVAGSTVTLSPAQARTGTRSLLTANGGINNGNVGARFTLGRTAITCGLGTAVYLSSLPGANAQVAMQFRDNANTPILTLCLQSDGSIAARKGDKTGTVLAISDSVLTAGTFNFIEAKAVFDTVAGSVQIKVNDVTKILIGSLNLGSVGAAQCYIGLTANGAPDTYWADLFAWDDSGSLNNTFIGPQRILTRFPTSDTAQADWAKNGAGTGYGCINNVPQDGDTTYLGAATVGNKSDFGIASLPPELVTIAAVVVPAMARLDNAGIGNLKMSLVSGASVAAGSDVPLTTGYAYYKNVFEIDPATSLPWTKAGLEAALIRAEKSL
jgi:hypothetical protein